LSHHFPYPEVPEQLIDQLISLGSPSAQWTHLGLHKQSEKLT
jgi:hypothetical protein